MNATEHPVMPTERFRSFHSWRASVGEREELEQRFEEWVFLNAAAVLLSEKTGELLSLSHREFPLGAARIEACLGRLAESWGFAYRLLEDGASSLKMIVYQPDRLQAVLDDAPFCVMGAKLNYAYPLRAETFIEELRERWQMHGQVPHEIGVALGYPLDDVFGYMGLLPLPCKGACGWQVYGCLRESERRSCAFNNARCQALVFLAGAGAARKSA